MLRTLREAVDDFLKSARSSEPAPADGEAEPPPAGGPLPDEGLSPARPASAARRLPGWRVWVAVGVIAIGGVLVLRWAPWSVREPADPEVVATYQGGVMTRERLRREFEALPKAEQPFYRTVNGLKMLIGNAVAHEVGRSWAEERQVDQKQAFKEAVKHATEEIKIADVSEQLHQGRIAVGEAEIQAYYDRNRERFGERPLSEVKDEIRGTLVEEKEQGFVGTYLQDLKERASLQVDYSLLEVPEPGEQDVALYYNDNRERFRVPEQVRVAQIQVSVSLAGGDDKARARAESARARAEAGEDFAQLARELSDGPERAQGGELPNPVARGGRGQAFDTAVLPLQAGQLSPVFKEGDSYYVVKLLERRPERLQPYEEARGAIAATLRAERERQAYAERRERTLFTIHSRRTTLGEFLQELDELPQEVRGRYSSPEGKRTLLDGLIERLLVVEDASEQAADVKRKQEIEHARSDLLGQMLHEEQVDEQVKIADEEVRAEYERNKARYADPPKVKVRYLRIGRGGTQDTDGKARAKIEEAEGKLKPFGVLGLGGQPAEFVEVAKQYSEDPQTAANGGELDRWLSEGNDPMGELFEHGLHEQLLPLKVGDISPILPLGDSYYLFQISDKQEARQRSFEETKVVVRRELEVRKHEELTRDMERRFLERMQLQVFDRRLEAVLAELGGPAVNTR